MKNSIFILLVVFSFNKRICAQNYYNLKTGTANYSNLINPIWVTGDSLFQGYNMPDTVIFPFYGYQMDFNSRPLKGYGVYVGKDGFIAVDESPGYDFTEILDIAYGSYRKRDTTSSISLGYEGQRGSGILKIQWKNMAIDGYSNSNYVNFQMWFNEADKSISFHYGPSVLSKSLSPVIGLMRAPNVGDTLTHSTFLKGNAAQPSGLSVYHSKTLPVFPVNGFPSDGTVYTFTHNTSRVDVISSQTDFTIFPNPAKDKITVSPFSAASLKVFDMNGKLLIQAENLSDLNVSDLLSGLYLLLIDNRSLYKFVKE